MFFFRIILLLLLSIVSFQACSAEWLVEPSAFLRTQYNDNIRMVPVDKEDATGYLLEPRLILEGNEQNDWSMRLNTKFKSVRYPGVSDANSDNIFLKFSGMSFTEISQLGFNASYEDNTTFDLDYDTQTSLSGLLSVPVEIKTLYFSPYWYVNTSEMTNISISLNASVQEYDDDAPDNYNDFDSSGGSVSAGWDYSENTTLGFLIQLSSVESDDLDYENDTQTMQLSYDYDISRNSALSIVLGQSKIDYVYSNQYLGCQDNTFIGELLGFCDGTPLYGDAEGGQTVSNYSFEYANEDELNETGLALSRSVTTSSLGSATQTDKYSIDYTRHFSKRLNLRLLLSLRESESLDEIDTNQDSRRFRFEPTVSWRLTEDMELRFLYRYLEQKFVQSNRESVSNSVYVNLSIKWPKAISSY